jgi:hypothetical protein
MILEDDSTSPSAHHHHHHHHHDEDDNDSTTTSALATAAITAATYSRLGISPVLARRSISGNSMIYSEPKRAVRLNHNRSQRHPYYSSFDDDCDDEDCDCCDDCNNSILDDDDRNEANDSSFENGRGEDWTRTKHPSLFARPFLRRRSLALAPPPFPSLLSTSITDRAASASAWRIRQQQRHSTATTKTAPRNKRTRWLIPARHPLKLCWDVLTVVLSLANAYATHAAIRDREFLANSFLRFCEVWFVIDILLNFCTTRQVQPGVVLHTWQAVWARYLTSWFVIDVLSLFPAEVLYIQPIIEAQKRHSLLRKLQLRSKTVARVTSRLVRYKIWIWARPVLHQTKRVVGMSVVTTIRMLIKYIPKYVLFVRNMKGVIALRALRQVHWIRNVYLTWWTTSRRRAATRAVAIKKSRSSSSFTLRQRFLLRRFGPHSHYRDDDTEILTEDDGDYGSSNANNNNNNPDWEFLRDDDPF